MVSSHLCRHLLAVQTHGLSIAFAPSGARLGFMVTAELVRLTRPSRAALKLSVLVALEQGWGRDLGMQESARRWRLRYRVARYIAFGVL